MPPSPPSHGFFEPLPPPSKLMHSHGVPPTLKNEAPPIEKQSPTLIKEVPFQKMIPRKKYKKNQKLPFAKNSTNT